MEFNEKYLSASESAKKPDANKVVISDDNYAICELLNKIFMQLDMIRRES